MDTTTGTKRELVPGRYRNNGHNWTNQYYRCTADTADEQKECNLFIQCTEKAKERLCKTAEDFQCIFCQCGCSNICTATAQEILK